MSLASLTLLDGTATTVEADDCSSVLAHPYAESMLLVTAAQGASRITKNDGSFLDVRGTPATVSATLAIARGWSRVQLAVDVSIDTVALADITGLLFPVEAGKRYVFWGRLLYTVGAATTGAAGALNGPAATSFFARIGTPSTISTMNDRATGAYDTPSAAFSASAGTSEAISIEGWIQPSASGNVQARGCSEVALTAVTFKAGSFIEYRQVA